MLIDDRLHPIAVCRLLLPRPLCLAEHIEVIAIPDVEAKRQVCITPLHNPIKLPVQILVPFEPESLPNENFRIAQQHTQKLDERAIDKLRARARLLEIRIDFLEGHFRALDVNVPLDSLVAARRTETARCFAGNQSVKWALALIAPHDTVD